MQQVQPVLRLAVLLLAATQGQAKKVGSLEDKAPLPPRYDFSRYFGAHGGGGDPGGGLGRGLGGGLGQDKPAAAASDRDTGAGFVEPVDFKSFFGGGNVGGGFGTQRQAASPFFGASNKEKSRLPFGSSPFGGLAAASSAESDDFGDFSKSKRGAGAAGEGRGLEQQSDDDFFSFDFADGGGGGGGTKADIHDEDGEERDEAEDDDGDTAGHSKPLKAANARYPSYSSYYHTQPEQLRAGGGGDSGTNAEAQEEDDFGFDEEEGGGGGAAADIRTGERTPLASSAEAYDSRPFRDASQHTADPASAFAGKGSGPSKFNLQSGFVPSPVDPLRTQASQEQASQAAQSSKAASHAAVHAAVRAAHRAAANHGKTTAAAGTGLGLGGLGGFGGLGSNPLAAADAAGLGRVGRSFVRRTREEPDDAFFESYSDGDEKEGDDYRFGPEAFGEEEDEDEGTRGKQAAESDDDGEVQQSAAATPGACKKVKKKGSICMICADPKTGGNYEQCQYATEPETQSYSFGRSSSYGNPRGGKGKSRRRRRREEDRQQQEAKDSSLQDTSQETSQDTSSQDTSSQGSQRQQGGAGEAPESLAVGLDSTEEDHAKIQEELDRSLEQLQGPKYEDYFSFLFPELTKEKELAKDKKGKKKDKKENKSKKSKKGKKKKKTAEEDDSEEVSSLLSHLEDDEEDPFTAETTSAVGRGPGPSADLWLGPPESAGAPGGVGVVPKKDLERMLGEFQQKDRSDCTKVEKDKMTCYQCVDKKGMQHEECMFVAASEPKQSHVAYHQSSAFKQPGPPPKAGASAKASTKAKADAATAATATKAATAKANPTANKAAATAHAVASNNAPSAVAAPAKGGAKSRQQRAAEKAQAEGEGEGEAEAEDDDDEKEDLQDEDEEVVEPEGLGQGPDDGMFTEETKPVFDRALKMSLPKYMLDRSENERVFDEVLASGV